MKRWIRRILFILLGFLLIYTAVVLVILCTDLPRELIVKYLNDNYGLNVTIDSMQITSGGKTTIDNLSVNLPMENAAIITVPQIVINHTKIPFVLFQGFKLKTVRIDKPLVNISQDQTGTWNAERLSYYFKSDSSGSRRNLSLPDIDIIDANVIVTDKNGRKDSFNQIFLQGKSSKSHEWDFHGDIASQIKLDGRLAQSGDYYHEVNIDVNGLPKTIQSLFGNISEPFNLNATWKGRVSDNGLSGVLNLSREGKFQADGNLDLNMSSDGLSVNINEVIVSGLDKSLETIKVAGGKINYNGKQVQAKNIFIEALANQASVTGNWNIEERRGDVYCSVTGTIKEKGIEYENILSGNISWPENGKKQIDLLVTSHGSSPWGNWKGNADLLGSGETWSSSKWKVTIPSLAWFSEKNNIELNDIDADIIAEWPVIKFDDIRMTNAQVINAKGQFSADTKSWNVSLETAGLKVITDQGAPIDLKLTAKGNMQNISVDDFHISYGSLQLEGNSKMSLSTKELSDTHIRTLLVLDPGDRNNDKIFEISAELECDTEVTGAVWPVNLQCKSIIAADNIKVDKQEIKPLKIFWQAKIDSNNVTYNAEQFVLFDGTWSLDGQYDIKENSAQLKLNTEQVSLRPIMQLFELPIECKGIMQAAFDVTIPVDNITQMVISGNWNVKDLTIPPIQAKEAEGRIIIEHGIARFDRIRLLQGKGLAQGDVWFRLNQPEYVYVNVDAQKWPIAITRYNMILTTNANGLATIDISKQTMNAKGDISTEVEVDQKKIANISADIVVDERLLDFNDMTITALGGGAKGNLSIPLDDWTNSKASMDWNEMNLGELAVYYPELASLYGKSSGSVSIKKAESKRAFEPLQIDISGKNEEVSLNNAKLGDYRISAYLGTERLLIDQFEIDSMNGKIKSYGNISRQDGNYSLYMNADFSEIEINQLLHTFLPDAKPVVGKLAGKGLLVIFSDLKRMTGDANIQISESDFAQTKIVGTLYNTMKLKFRKNKPSGTGRVRLRFEGSSLHIPSFEYFNRGVEIRGSGSIEDLTKGKSSPVTGYAFGSARPLKGINLLGIGELDKLMTSLQKRASSVQVSGSLESYDVEVVPFKDIKKGLRVLLWDQLHK